MAGPTAISLIEHATLTISAAIIEILSASVEFLEQIPQRPNDAELLKDVNAQLIKEVPGLEPFLTGQTKVCMAVCTSVNNPRGGDL